ncbi:hypothetical protein A2634_05200 [Candidatus Amesbacteria bacterium RIFCSPHIGHO2_01_FULL_48_32]|uniref:Uncharacterized protein n=1 Tax=Candidatus Amesbacteria bacterium RIFCSPLOWO2_01_FULL_48_25 TaxID=1797259 RepID=A0A1F4ZD24_9BACT|nr:MAG: hypothetical protein A2634_05200 [Candidatus Amesbacteria bacterium RIFCSPHIGHO2_01_FULL_48_32]OGD04065.1 MAG: hypothetical protein A2989_01545 [Candidatus Amesbacteria bacterium RIFCSPLOWO2_01_FULL_48_25]HJZ05671.1 hypothetical protein [Patescibacteria group bacterium]
MPEGELLHDLSSKSNLPPKALLIIGAAVLIISGAVVGFLLTQAPQNGKTNSSSATPAMVKSATEIGSTDTQTFRDTATGTLETGGSNGEGTHHLTRDGGPSQTVYLISSIVDLEQYLGKKVQVWGETIRAQRVGWLMDVGRLKILE